MADGEGSLRPAGITAGQWIRGAAVVFMISYMAAGLWARFAVLWSSDIIAVLHALLPAAVAVAVVHCYLMLAPDIAKFRWALKNPSGSSSDYRAHREDCDLRAMGRARTGVGRWIIGLRRGTW